MTMRQQVDWRAKFVGLQATYQTLLSDSSHTCWVQGQTSGSQAELTALSGIALVMQVGRGIWERVARPVSAPEPCASILHQVRGISYDVNWSCVPSPLHLLMVSKPHASPVGQLSTRGVQRSPGEFAGVCPSPGLLKPEGGLLGAKPGSAALLHERP